MALTAEQQARLRNTHTTLAAAANRQKYSRYLFFKPYPKQMDHYALGATKRERLLMAGNQVGKSEAGAYEDAMHATGRYLDWWPGKRFDKPTRGWAIGVTSLDTRNILQKKLFGAPGVIADHGTGFIPKEDIVDTSLARGVTDAFDTVQVKHHRPNGEVDGISTIHFKSYEQGRTKLQGDTIDWAHCDEEPEKMEVYSEILARLTGDGILATTFTPLLGKTDLTMRFTEGNHEDRAITYMTLDDAQHFTAEQKRKRLEGYLLHEREARAKGVPMLGSGRIFLYDETFIEEEPIRSIPQHWKKLWAIDFGIGHPFAAVLQLWDVDMDVIHIHHCIRIADQLPMFHAKLMKDVGIDVPVAWPQDGTAREKSSGEALSLQYKKEGLLMLPEHATWEDGGISTEAAILEMDTRMRSGKYKVSKACPDWFEEYRTYHRKDGQIVKVRDDLMSASQKGVMMKRAAKAVLLGGKSGRQARRGMENMCAGVDIDPFTGQ